MTAVAGARSADRVRRHGATRVIDYGTDPALEALSGEQFDVVLHLVRNSPEETAELVRSVTDGGLFVSTTTPGPTDPGRRVTVEQVYVRSDAEQLAELARRVDEGSLTIDVAERRSLADLGAVHEEGVTGRLRGKTVLVP